jgi:hypothetical protein
MIFSRGLFCEARTHLGCRPGPSGNPCAAQVVHTPFLNVDQRYSKAVGSHSYHPSARKQPQILDEPVLIGQLSLRFKHEGFAMELLSIANPSSRTLRRSS